MHQIDYHSAKLMSVMMLMHLENDQQKEKTPDCWKDQVLLFVVVTLFVVVVVVFQEKLISLIVSKAIQTMLT